MYIVLNIKELSKVTFEKLIDWGWVESIIDIFYLYKHDKEWIKKSGFEEKSVFKILNSIESGKNITLKAFISAIVIPLIGLTAAKDLAKYFNTYLDFLNSVKDNNYNFAVLNNFGIEMNNSIKNFDYTEKDKISYLFSVKNLKKGKNGKLKGKNIVIVVN